MLCNIPQDIPQSCFSCHIGMSSRTKEPKRRTRNVFTQLVKSRSLRFRGTSDWSEKRQNVRSDTKYKCLKRLQFLPQRPCFKKTVVRKRRYAAALVFFSTRSYAWSSSRSARSMKPRYIYVEARHGISTSTGSLGGMQNPWHKNPVTWHFFFFQFIT